ncbi:MAG: AraC family transcriptional regulator [Cyanobacteria bacterium J06627_8]
MSIKNDPLLVFPNAPILSSDRANWQSISFAHFRQPPHGVPEYTPSHHMICMNVGKTVMLEQSVDGKREIAYSTPGDLGIYPAYLSQKFCWEEDVEFFNLFLEPSFIAQVGYEVFGRNCCELIPNFVALNDPLIQQICFALKKSLEIDQEHSRLYADSMAQALVVHLLSRYSTHLPKIQLNPGGLTKRQQQQIFEYIQVNLDRNISLVELAGVLKFSPCYFARLFKNSTGIPPHQYLLRCRIERAKQLLTVDSLSIAAVAQRVGFASQGHFTYHFKRFVGITPKAFLRRSQER